MPVPARLVIDSGGVVRAADIDVDYTRRPEATKTLDDLDSLLAAGTSYIPARSAQPSPTLPSLWKRSCKELLCFPDDS